MIYFIQLQAAMGFALILLFLAFLFLCVVLPFLFFFFLNKGKRRRKETEKKSYKKYLLLDGLEDFFKAIFIMLAIAVGVGFLLWFAMHDMVIM